MGGTESDGKEQGHTKIQMRLHCNVGKAVIWQFEILLLFKVMCIASVHPTVVMQCAKVET